MSTLRVSNLDPQPAPKRRRADLARPRWAVVWFPNWPVQRALREMRLQSDQILLLTRTPTRGATEVMACSAAGGKLGIRPGMSAAEAESLGSAYRFVHLPYDPGEDRRTLEKVARLCQRFSPVVAVEEMPPGEPECLCLEIGSGAHLFGGAESLVHKLAAKLGQHGLTSHVAAATTIGQAWAVAHHGGNRRGTPQEERSCSFTVVPPDKALETISPLPLSSLRLPAATIDLLRQLGIVCVGQLLELPRSALPSRFGPQLLQRLDQALGYRSELVQPCPHRERLLEVLRFDEPIDRLEYIQAVWEEMLPRLLKPLSKRQEGVRQLLSRLHAADGTWHERLVSLFRPTLSTRHLLELLSMQWEVTPLSQPVSEIRLEVLSTDLLETQQKTLFPGIEAETNLASQLASLVDRLTSRLGRENVLRANLAADPRPHLAARYQPLIDTGDQFARQAVARRGKSRRGGARKFGTDEPEILPVAPRPVCFFRQPEALEMLQLESSLHGDRPKRIRWQQRTLEVLSAWGPERIEAGWWRGETVWRDYYRVELAAGERLWIFRCRRTGRWYVQGCFE